MTDAAAEVARIKGEFAARDAAWMAIVEGRLKQGPALSGELAFICGIDRKNKGVFSTFLQKQRSAGKLVVVGTQLGPNGWPNNLWSLP